jgi:hypothetical protein
MLQECFRNTKQVLGSSATRLIVRFGGTSLAHEICRVVLHRYYYIDGENTQALLGGLYGKFTNGWCDYL